MLTTEQLRERIGHLKERLRDMKQHKYPDNCPNAAAYLESLKVERQQDIELLEELLANREAQPVAWQETLSRAAKAFEALLETAGHFDKEVWAGVPAQLRALTAPPEGWIACSERMPEEGVVVLCCEGDDISTLFHRGNGIWDDGDFHSNITGVTHWMPLPAAPEVSRDDA